MKKLVLITGIILMVCLFTSVYASPAVTAGTNTAATEENKGSVNEVFMLKSENNRIVVYKFGEDTPYIITDTLVSTLPKGDIMLIEKGIEIKGEENLKKSLEDYCS